MVLGTVIPIVFFGLHYAKLGFARSPYVAFLIPLLAIYGIALEAEAVRTWEAYQYADLLWMVGTAPSWVPVIVGISWSNIIYLTMLTSDCLALPEWQKPFFDGMLAVMIDLVMDPVTSATITIPAGHIGRACIGTGPEWGGAGLWVWCVHDTTTHMWYNVPYSNFVGWFFVVAVASAVVRYVRHQWNITTRSKMVQYVAAAGVTAVATVLCTVLVKGVVKLMQGGLLSPTVAFALVTVGPLAFVALNWGSINRRNALNWPLMLFPMFVFIVEPVSYVVLKMDPSGWPWLPLKLAGTALVGVAVLMLPSWGVIAGQSPAPETR
jgi:hypothetical protein